MKLKELGIITVIAILCGSILLWIEPDPKPTAAVVKEIDVTQPTTTVAKVHVDNEPAVGLTADINREDGTWYPYGAALILLNTGDTEEFRQVLGDVAAVCMAWSNGDIGWEGEDHTGRKRYGLCGTTTPATKNNPRRSAEEMRAMVDRNLGNGIQALSGDDRWIDGSYREHLPAVHEAIGPILQEEYVFVARIPVHRDIAEPLAELLAHAKKDGFELTGWGWRSPEKQIELRFANCSEIRNDKASQNHEEGSLLFTLPPSKCETPTAVPGTSRHESGKAIDFNKGGRGLRPYDAEFAWLKEHAADYGFFNLPSEAWHWSVDGK